MKKETGAPVPFHEGPDWAAAKRRVLLVSWEFPPRMTAGALRWEKFARFLHEAGIGLDVVAAPPGVLDQAARSRLAALPPSVRIFGLDVQAQWLERSEDSVVRLARRLVSRRSAATTTMPDTGTGVATPTPPATPGRPVSLPPERITWLPREPRDILRGFWAMVAHQRDMGWGEDATILAKRIAGKNTVAVVTCGPPHGAHVAGRRLGEALGVPHILDYRDPWSLRRRVSEAHASPVAFALARRKEGWILEKADLVVTNTDTVRLAMEKAHPGSRARFITIYNGYDDEPIPDADAGCFRVLYAGGIYLDRDPRTLFRGAAMAIEATGASPGEFQVELVGNVARYDGIPIADIAAAEGLKEHLAVRSAIPRSELLLEMASASVLVSLPQDSPWAIPSKIFEYMPFKAAMLVYARSGTPTADLLAGTEIDLLDPSDAEGTRDMLAREFLAYRAGADRGPAVCDDRFSRAGQAGRLLEELERCIRKP